MSTRISLLASGGTCWFSAVTIRISLVGRWSFVETSARGANVSLAQALCC